MKKITIISYSVLMVGILFNASCSGNKSERKEKRNITVTTMAIESENNSFTREYIGVTEAESAGELSFSVSGQVDGIYVSEGEKVKKGQRLASVDAVTLHNSYLAAQSSCQQAQDAYERMKKLYDNGSLPEIKFVEVRTRLNQAESAYAISRKQLNDAVIYAPYDGFISKSSITVGENVIPGKPVFTLLDTDNLKIRFSVPEKEIGLITTGDIAEIRIPTISKESIKGKVTEKGVTTSSLNPLYEVKVKIDNAKGAILPGMTCNVHIINEKNEKLIIVPVRSVMLGENGKKYVWTIKEGKAEQTEIETGDFSKDGVIVKSGLIKGDKIVVGGYQKISKGMNIEEK